MSPRYEVTILSEEEAARAYAATFARRAANSPVYRVQVIDGRLAFQYYALGALY